MSQDTYLYICVKNFVFFSYLIVKPKCVETVQWSTGKKKKKKRLLDLSDEIERTNSNNLVISHKSNIIYLYVSTFVSLNPYIIFCLNVCVIFTYKSHLILSFH